MTDTIDPADVLDPYEDMPSDVGRYWYQVLDRIMPMWERWSSTAAAQTVTLVLLFLARLIAVVLIVVGAALASTVRWATGTRRRRQPDPD